MTKVICTVTNDLSFDQRMHRMCSALSENGYDITLVGRRKKNSILLSEKLFKQKRLNCFFEKGKLFYLEYNIRLFCYLIFNKFDVVHSVDLDTLVPGYFVSKLKGEKIVFDAHELFTELPELEGREIVIKIWQSIENRLVPKLKHCITVNNSLVSNFKERLNVDFFAIYNVPEALDNNENLIVQEKYILYQGAVNKGRGLKELIDAIEKIEIKLKIAGEGDEYNFLKDYASNKNYSNKIEFLGYLEPKQLKGVTKNAFIGVNLLENYSLNYYYSLANKFFDYIHCNVPQITMNFPEYKTINNEFEVACLIEDLSVEEIKFSIEKLLNDNNFYSSLKSNCKNCSNKYNWQKEKNKLLKFYQEAIS